MQVGNSTTRKEATTFYEKDGKLTAPIPYHGAKEIGKGLASKLIKKYGV